MKTSNKILIGGFCVLVILVIVFILSGKAVLNRELGMEGAEQPAAIVETADQFPTV